VDERARPFLETLDADALAAIDRVGMRRTVRPGATVLLEGELASRIGVIRSGLVKVTALHPDGYEAVLAIRGPGELLGEVAAFDGGVRSASATALSDGEIQFIDTAAFEGLLGSHPSIAVALVRTLAARLRESDAHRLQFAADGVPRRLARTLVQLADEHGTVEGDTIVIDLAFTQDDLAGVVAASRDAVAKTLKTWRDQGLVETSRRRIVLCDAAALSRQHRL